MPYPAVENEEVSPLLRLPLELRREIYRYVLPSTAVIDTHLSRGTGEPPELSRYDLTYVRSAPPGQGEWKMQRTTPRTDREIGHEIVWYRGCIRLLAVNRQVHDECVDMIYGDNTFVVHVAFDGIKFQYKWLTSANLTPNGAKDFLVHFSQRNLLRIKNYVINVEHVDEYTGMIKYNCGSRGLNAGIRQQVSDLVDLLALVPGLHRLRVHLIDGAIGRVKFPSGRVHRVQDAELYSESQKVLEPFSRLYEVRKAHVSGVSLEFAEALEQSITASRVGT